MESISATITARLFRLSTAVFFMGGFVASVLSLLVPRLRTILALDYAAATSIQLASHSSYLLLAIPTALAVSRFGFMRAHVAGLLLMACGLVGVGAGSLLGSLPCLLAALMLISAGATFLQIASNTVVTIVGDPKHAAARLNALQGLNSLGTVLGPLTGAGFLLNAGASAQAARSSVPFLVSAMVLAGLATAFWSARGLLDGTRASRTLGSRRDWIEALRGQSLRAGLVAIFCYVGAEVTIGALLPNILMLPSVMAATPIDAGRLVSLYWGCAMIGRFAGAWILRRVRAPALLSCAGAAALGCGAIALLVDGPGGGVALILIGLFNSVMYPTIYVLAIPSEPHLAIPGSTMLCMAVVGGAIVPFVTGLAADSVGLSTALVVPVACYAAVLWFGVTHQRTVCG